MSAILELKDLDVFYGPIQALKKVSLHINEGETVSLIGSNGAGKSTLLMSIFGQPRAAAGRFSIKASTSPKSRRTTSPPTASRNRRKGGGCSPT
jgi:ABC-type branched-subunit amino acid transport system ATPase component